MPSSQGSPARTPARAAALAFLAAGATLFVQVLVHRMVSAKLLNNYAFLVISLTMLGFALSGVLLTRLLGRFLREWPDALTLSAAGFVLSTLAVSVAFYRMGGGDQFTVSFTGFLREFLRWLPTALLFAIPFTFSGLMIGALLSDPDLPAPRVYAFDLAGSALGAFAVIPAIRHLGVEASTLARLRAPPGRHRRAGAAAPDRGPAGGGGRGRGARGHGPRAGPRLRDGAAARLGAGPAAAPSARPTESSTSSGTRWRGSRSRERRPRTPTGSTSPRSSGTTAPSSSGSAGS